MPSTTDAAASHRRWVTGVLLLVAAATLWSFSGALVKLLHSDGDGPHGVIIAWYRSLIAGLFLLPFARGGWRSMRATHGPYQHWPIRPAAIWCLFFYSAMTVLYLVAMTMTQAGAAILLQYTSNLWVFALSPALLGEQPRIRDIWILVLAMVGVLIIFLSDVGGGGGGQIAALVSGLFYGLLTLMIRRMRDCDSAAVSVVNNLGSAIVILPLVLYLQTTEFSDTPDMTLAVSGRTLWILALLGVVQFGFPYYLFTLGLARVPAYQAGLIVMIELILVPIWAYVAVGEVMPTQKLVGGVFIVVALVLLALLSMRSRREG